MKSQIKQLITSAIEQSYPEHVGVEFSVDYPPAGVEADFASNVALVLSKRLGLEPLELAIVLQEKLGQIQSDFAVHIAVPGFLNFQASAKTWQEELQKILKAGEKYGSSKINKGKKARVEYVSANPTGPIHIGNVRGGPYGEVIGNVLESTGYKVLREYIHNDVGGQVQKLSKTIWYWYEKLQDIETEFPEDGYQGEYPREVAEAAMKKFGKKLTEKDLPKLTKFSLELIFRENLHTLKRLGIGFDLIVKESQLQKSGKVKKATEELKKKGLARENEGALWFAPNDEFLSDREAVIIKSNGEPTYFASDIAYHEQKFTSGYDLVVDIFGSNHHGHVPKLQALTKIFGFDPEKFKVLLYQYVRVKRGHEVVKMAKRAGNFITAKEVLDEVGKDSMIFLLLLTAVNTHVDFDLELAKDTSEKNPVFRVQYAHARINSILKKAERTKGTKDSFALQDQLEIELIRELAKFPELIQEIAQNYTVHHIPHYLLGLADKFHSFYEKIRVISDDKNETAARLELVSAVKMVIANGLKLIGIEPLEKM